LKSPVKVTVPKAKSIPVAGNSGGSGVASDDAVLRMPPVNMARNLRRVVVHNTEFQVEFNQAQHMQLDLLANLCGTMREISSQLHLQNILFEKAQGRVDSEVSESTFNRSLGWMRVLRFRWGLRR
jgi:hypothetical protein